MIEHVRVAPGSDAWGLGCMRISESLCVCTTLGGVTPPAQGGIQILGTGECGRLCDHARQVPAVFVGQWMVPLFSSSTEWWILPLCSETGAHSVKLCFSGLLIDMPVVVHVKVVDFPVVAQRSFLVVQFSRPLRFPIWSPLIRCSMSLLCRSSIFRLQVVRIWSRSHSCSR